MEQRKDAREEIARNLIDALDGVNKDAAKVEFWTSALIAFGQPVPDYNSGDFTVWLPREQGQALKPRRN